MGTLYSRSEVLKMVPIKHSLAFLVSVAATDTNLVQLSNGGSAEYTYFDAGSGADIDFSTWRAHPRGGYANLHNFPEAYSYQTPSSMVQALYAGNTYNGKQHFDYPVDYTAIWSDHGSGGDYDTTCWLIQCASGYVAISDVFSRGYSTPSYTEYMCVLSDLVTQVQGGSTVWTDGGSGSDQDLTVYSYTGMHGFTRLRCWNTSTGTGSGTHNVNYVFSNFAYA